MRAWDVSSVSDLAQAVRVVSVGADEGEEGGLGDRHGLGRIG